MSVLTTICARKGSKGIRNKAFAKIGGRTLLDWTLAYALDHCARLGDVIVSSDSQKILTESVPYEGFMRHLRSKALAKDDTPKIAAVRDAVCSAEYAKKKQYKYVIDLDITNPIREAGDIESALEMIRVNQDAPNLFSATISRKSPYFNIVEVENGRVDLSSRCGKPIVRRQDAPYTYDMNASFYIYRRAFLGNEFDFNVGSNLSHIVRPNSLVCVMGQESAIDIDTPLDLVLVEAIMGTRNG